MQQKPIAVTAATSSTVVVYACGTTEKNAVLDYALSADNTPVTVQIIDTGGSFGQYRLNTACPPVVVPQLSNGHRFVAAGTISLVVSTSCIVSGHICLAGVNC